MTQAIIGLACLGIVVVPLGFAARSNRDSHTRMMIELVGLIVASVGYGFLFLALVAVNFDGAYVTGFIVLVVSGICFARFVHPRVRHTVPY